MQKKKSRDIKIKHSLKAWTKKSQAIRRRDGFECQECKRYGKSVDAELVHHIFPAEEYPELFCVDNNLISLCNKCHELMHDRSLGILTKKGIEWQKRKRKDIPPLNHA